MPKYKQRDIDYIVDYHNLSPQGKRNLETSGIHPGIPGAVLDLGIDNDYVQHMHSIEQKYGNYFWLPLDVPKLEIDNIEEFLNFWDNESASALRQVPDIGEPWSKEDHPLGQKSSWYVPSFRELTLYQVPGLINNSIWSTKLYQGKHKTVDKIIDYVFEYYPVNKRNPVFQIFIWESLQDVKLHKDHSAFWKCLTDFRTMLYDENQHSTLYVVDTEKKTQAYIDLPADTNTFGWSNGRVLHGSDFHNKRKLLLIVNAVQCPEKTEMLLEKSIKKYQDQLNYSI